MKEAIIKILNTYKQHGALAEVVYQSPFKANVELDTAAHPVAVLYLFRDGSLDLATGLLRDIAEVNVLFLTHQPELDFDGATNDTLLDSMASLAATFIADIIASGVGTISGDNVTLRGIYDHADKNTTGVSMQFRLEAAQGRCLAPYEPEPEPTPEPTPEPEEPTKP